MLKKIILAAMAMAIAVYAQANIKIGAHAAGSAGTVWGDNTDLLEIGWGPGFNVGADAKFVFNPAFSLLTGIEFDYRRVSWDFGGFMKKIASPFMTSEYGYSSKYDQMMNLMFNMNITFSFLYVEVPVIARFNPAPNFYVDAGVVVGVNVISSATMKVDTFGLEDTEDVPDEAKNATDISAIAGVGYSVTENIDINFRAVFGFTDMIDFKKFSDSVDSETKESTTSSMGLNSSNSSYSADIGFKNMRFMLGATFWFI